MPPAAEPAPKNDKVVKEAREQERAPVRKAEVPLARSSEVAAFLS